MALKTEKAVVFVVTAMPNFPKSFGVLYSLTGADPNLFDDDKEIAAAKPYIHLFGDWYMSRKLVRGVRSLLPAPPLPAGSLIDRSLCVDGLENWREK